MNEVGKSNRHEVAVILYIIALTVSTVDVAIEAFTGCSDAKRKEGWGEYTAFNTYCNGELCNHNYINHDGSLEMPLDDIIHQDLGNVGEDGTDGNLCFFGQVRGRAYGGKYNKVI